MPLVRFSCNFDWMPFGRPNIMIHYEAGKVYTVTTRCLEEAVALKKATRVSKTRKRRKSV